MTRLSRSWICYWSRFMMRSRVMCLFRGTLWRFHRSSTTAPIALGYSPKSTVWRAQRALQLRLGLEAVTCWGVEGDGKEPCGEGVEPVGADAASSIDIRKRKEAGRFSPRSKKNAARTRMRRPRMRRLLGMYFKPQEGKYTNL